MIHSGAAMRYRLTAPALTASVSLLLVSDPRVIKIASSTVNGIT